MPTIFRTHESGSFNPRSLFTPTAMKLFENRLDISYIDPDSLFEPGRFEQSVHDLLPAALQSFAEMASDKSMSVRRDKGGYCAECGMHPEERTLLIRELATQYLRTASADDLRAIRKYLEAKLREYIVISRGDFHLN